VCDFLLVFFKYKIDRILKTKKLKLIYISQSKRTFFLLAASTVDTTAHVSTTPQPPTTHSHLELPNGAHMSNVSIDLRTNETKPGLKNAHLLLCS
jgi:hypothetical protein